ncbi:MAG TPA: hypothetical protein VK826_03330 [Bacteroidia bacterium]|nr:hypothetical protein [Bacteroidia bacterium]
MAAFLLLTLALRAQSLTLSVARDTFNMQDEITINLEGELGNFNNYATLPAIQGLMLMSHDKSFDYSGTNKKVLISQTFRFKAVTSGDFTAGPAWIQNASGRIFSNSVQFHVRKSSNPVSNGLVFLRCETDKKKVYTGEKITVSLQLYCAAEYDAGGDYPLANSYTGFWKQDDPSYQNNGETLVHINDQPFFRKTIAREFLFPNTTGILLLPQYMYTCSINARSNESSGLDAYGVTFDLKTDPVAITSIALPPHDSIPGYSGDVGHFTIASSLRRDTTEAWSPVPLTLTIMGEGNFQFLIAPVLNLPAGLRAQLVSSEDSVIDDHQRFIGARIFTYLITPEKAGVYDLANIGYSYFDPDQKKYITLYLPDYKLHVNPAAQIETDSVSNLPDSFFTRRAKSKIPLIITLSVVAVFGAIVFFVIARKRKKEKRAKQEELDRLKAAAEQDYVPPPDRSLENALAMTQSSGLYLQNGLPIPAVNALYEALIVRICGVTKMRKEEISVNTLKYRLALAKNSEETISETMQLYEELKLKRYALSPSDLPLAHQLLRRTVEVLGKLG